MQLLVLIVVGAIIVALGIALAPYILSIFGVLLGVGFIVFVLAGVGAVLLGLLVRVLEPAFEAGARVRARAREHHSPVVRTLAAIPPKVLWYVVFASALIGAGAWVDYLMCSPGNRDTDRCRAKYETPNSNPLLP
jgi:hypothetical protein